MIQKKTRLNISDNTNVIWTQTFHLYKGFFRRFSFTGLIIKGSVRKIKPPRIEYRGFKLKLAKKGDIVQMYIFRTKNFVTRPDAGYYRTLNNNGILLKKKKLLKSKYLYGPSSRLNAPTKFLTLIKRFL